MFFIMTIMTNIFKIIKIQSNIGVVYILRSDVYLMVDYVSHTFMTVLTQTAVNYYSFGNKSFTAIVPLFGFVKVFCILFHDQVAGVVVTVISTVFPFESVATPPVTAPSVV